jgi:hypothetical protein
MRISPRGRSGERHVDKSELEADSIFNPDPHSMDEFWYLPFDKKQRLRDLRNAQSMLT